MAAEEGEREKGRASVMIRRCFNDSAFLWQRACRGWPPRRPASVSSGGGECIERPAAILVDTQPRFSGMNFCVCARVRACTPVPFSLPVLLSLCSAIPPPCDAHTRDRPLLSSRSFARSRERARGWKGCNLLFYLLLHLPFPPLPLSSHTTEARQNQQQCNVIHLLDSPRHETFLETLGTRGEFVVYSICVTPTFVAANVTISLIIKYLYIFRCIST